MFPSPVSNGPDADTALQTWYAQPNVIHLGWLDRPSRHHFRWRTPDGRWVMAKRRFSSGQALVRHFGTHLPADLYVSTASWLDPVDLPGRRDRTQPPPVMLDHLVVFDLDLGPFSKDRLETVRKRASALHHWVEGHTDLQFLHVTFSGGKGFHVVYRDPDRSAFAIEEPRARENAVRDARAALLQRVLDAGHAVDTTVTADTRRIIRVPGSLHGTTGWACSILDDGLVHRPLRAWVDDLPRGVSAVTMPRRPPKTPRIRPPTTNASQAEVEPDLRLSVEVSTHVQGTKDRTAVVALVPQKVSREGRVLDFIETLPQDLAPVALFSFGDRHLVIVPRALPRARAIHAMEEAGLGALAARHSADGHAWVALAATDHVTEEGVVPCSLHRLDHHVLHPWSRPHVEVCHRLGLTIPPSVGEVAGTNEPAYRFAQRG